MASYNFICGCCCVVMLLLQCFSGMQRCNSTINGASFSSSIMIASRALLDFKARLTSYSPGGSVLPSWVNGSNPCDAKQLWEGVTCDDTAGRNIVVVALRLQGKDLSGAISPTALARLCEAGLTVLDLSYNNFSASIPAEALGACRYLRHLNLEGNSFSGSLPTSAFSNLSALQHLDLSLNSFSGSLGPSVFSNLSALQHLDLSENSFSGFVGPSVFSNLSALQHLDLSFNSFSGSLTPSIWHLPALHTLNLLLPSIHFDQYNPEYIDNILQAPDIPADLPFCANITQLSVLGVSLMSTKGNLMTSLSKCAMKLQSVYLEQTNLTGSIPEDFWQLPSLTELHLGSPGTVSTSSLPASMASCSNNLQYLWLSKVSLGGATLPPFMGNCKKLRTLVFCQTGVQGVIPQSMWKLPALENIMFFEPHLRSEASLPPQLPSCGTIQIISIRGVNIGGQIPPSLGNCSFLGALVLSGVRMRGPIPETLGNLSQLQYLDVSNNSLNGDVPASALVNCTSLEVLRLHQNCLTGALDQLALWKMKNLAVFMAHQNRLHGRLTANLTSSRSLQLVDLGNNNLLGMMPSQKESQGLQGLRVLVLSNSRLSGEIPTWVWELPSLQMLDLSNCSLAGVIPASIAHLPYFKRIINYTIITVDSSIITLDSSTPKSTESTPTLPYSAKVKLWQTEVDQLDIPFQEGEHQRLLPYLLSNRISLRLSHNSFRGRIPDSLGELVGLTSLDLSHNSLSGPIPPSLGKLSQLQVLDLSSNSLQGTIPSELGRLDSLGTLNLSYNHLVGPIPTTHNFNTRFDNATSFQGNGGLCGFPLPNPCTKNATNTTTNNTTNSNDTTSSSSWFDDNISLGGLLLGYILGLLGVLFLLWWRNMKHGWLMQLHLF